MDQSANLDHPTIGSLRGLQQSPEVEQYLGIQYATLADRFSRGTLIESYARPLDAINHGPLPVANPANCDQEQLLIQKTLPHPQYTFSDTECLTLNVTVPNGHVRAEAGNKLPVMVFIHGGGFMTGSANWPQWDLARLVGLSVQEGKPIVAIGVNYRLGLFGFMASSAMTEAGYKPNNGLHDQKLALRWVQRHIAGFGGDPEEVTVFGCSIGGASGFHHLQSPERLFKRLAAHGGNGLMRPLPLEVGEVGYGMVIKALGLESLSPTEQIEQLLRIPYAELEAKIRDLPAPLSALLDGDIIRSVPTFKDISEPDSAQRVFPGMDHCQKLWMGSCGLDGHIFIVLRPPQPDGVTQALNRCITNALSPSYPDLVAPILALYGLDSLSSSLINVSSFLTAIGFTLPAQACFEAWESATGKASYLTRFACSNPWDGPWKGHATHGLDAVFMLQNYNEFLDDEQKAVAVRMGQDMVRFVNGEGASRDLEAYAGVDDGKKDDEQVEKRRVLERIVGGRVEAWDRLMDAVGLFMSGA